MDRCSEKASGWECVGRGNKGNLLFTFFRRGPKEIFGVGRYRSNPRRVRIRLVTHETILTSQKKKQMGFRCGFTFPEISRNFLTGRNFLTSRNRDLPLRDLPRATRDHKVQDIGDSK